jgi:hypothetical protein
VARVPVSSGVLFPPPFGELEGDGSGAVLHAFFCCSSRVAMSFFMLEIDNFRMLQ